MVFPILFSMSLKEILMMLPAILICITFHELSHGYAAYLLGDDTAKNMGRLTLNPLAHLDIIGFLCMLLAGIGWAKPVPVSPMNFKMKNKKVGMAITALAGPLSNFILAFFFLLISYLIYFTSSSVFLTGLADFLYITALLSVGLAAFNLLPIPPLDGSKIILPLFPNSLIAKIYRIEKYIQLALLLLLFVGLFDGIISTVRNWILSLIYEILEAIFSSAGII